MSRSHSVRSSLTAAVRKLQHPRVFALTLERLEPALVGRRSLAIRAAVAIAIYEATVAVGVVAGRGGAGFVFACALLVACAGFLLALARAVQQHVPCACFGRLGRTAAGGREIGRGFVLVAGAALLVVHRAIDARTAYGFGPWAAVALVATGLLIVAGQRIGAAARPGVELQPAARRESDDLRSRIMSVVGFDNDLYSTNG